MAVNYAFVLDNQGQMLDPTKTKKAWYLIRQGKAELVEEYPLIIQLNRAVSSSQINNDEIVLGIDDGVKYIGFALLQDCKTKNKVLFKAKMKQRQDVSSKMEERSDYRRYRRLHKRYRPERFDNRSASKRKGRLSPSIKQRKQAILRVVKYLSKYIRLDKIVLEDVAIDIRKLTEGEELYSWQYQESNRLDENLRKATLKRDDYTCQLCGVEDTILHAHHIMPVRDGGADSIYNLITLCADCHNNKVDGNEYEYKEQFLTKVEGKELDLKPAMHVMQGKSWLREKLSTMAKLEITTGGDTANRRIDYNIEKTHSNDAICITGLLPIDRLDIKEYFIKPLRKKKASKIDSLGDYKHRDVIRYTKRNGTTYLGYITALRVKNNKYNSKVCNFTTLDGEKTFRGYGLGNLTLVNRPQGLMVI